MIDVDDTLRSELHRLVPRDSRRDWDEVAVRSGLKQARVRRRWSVVVAVLAGVTVLGVATPLGAGLARTFDDFSAWLSGEPGTPASEREQEEFEAADSRSWLRFPQGTRLRHLVTKELGSTTVQLVGFRSGSSTLCLRLRVTGESSTTALECAPLDELRRAGGPARVVIADHHAGKGDKAAWYGIDHLQSSALQITAGIVTDAVRAVVLEDDAGRHEVEASSNGFLYVAEKPDVGQRVKKVWARTAGGGLLAVPFAPAPWGFHGGASSPVAAPPAPRVERRIDGGKIGWLEAREPRGESLDALPADVARGGPRNPRSHVLFGRVLTPDPDRPLRMVLTLNAQRPGGPAKGLCTWHVIRGGAAGGCTTYPDIFRRTPIMSGMSGGGSGAFMTASGVASDDVARIEALLADGQSADVTLGDNTFVIDLPRVNLPARLIAYDAGDRVIGVSEPFDDFSRGAGPARGRATLLLRVSGGGATSAELFVGPSTDGGECMYVKEFVDPQHAGVGVHCQRPVFSGRPLQLSASWSPPRFVSGRVHPDVETVRIRFADGSSTTLVPTRGYVLWAVPEEHRAPDKTPVEARGLRKDGTVVGRQSLGPPERATRSRRSSSRR